MTISGDPFSEDNKLVYKTTILGTFFGNMAISGNLLKEHATFSRGSFGTMQAWSRMFLLETQPFLEMREKWKLRGVGVESREGGANVE